MDHRQKNLVDIAHYLMLHGSFINNIGLLNGKMGIVLFFFHYSRFTKCTRYADFANCMLEEVYEDISKNTPKDFSNGLSGIAFGISYLVAKDFVKIDPDVFEELDAKMMEWDVDNISDYSLQTGLAGIGSYVLLRYNNEIGQSRLPMSYINKLLVSLSESNDPLCLEIYRAIRYNSNVIELMDKILYGSLPGDKMSKHIVNIGLDNGMAGVGLSKILKGNEK